ncbi:hypothetical protein KAFR_0H02190 [Kazachstania africana CBS 2517]|uniref:Na+/H+ antiporter n=1 Tax=Kazachstania africana (strain ATCC 22294 / BCRC 22015 / CBS 2517 / CECT 1963 / NBRC 1671 / NRRL Y-8276) TaxID=1071382 RepID=H2AZ72_KAZAF|nr:hypothetical protein KAFR_0H02190 [Kazachstania africana CBS 2517]CCF59628.1 hypothetical protein KAFR_0H02190 [Kazachstania africana CBS 2517]
MAVWEQINVSKAHVAYACVGVFSSVFSLVSLFVKEKLYIGESMVAALFGLIVGPVCLDWFNPLKWGNSDDITLEITRIVLCLQIFAVAVELPRKYMLKHWLSVTMLLIPVMTTGWLIIGLFIWIIIPGLNFSDSLLVSACITATDPILAQSVVSGKFAQRVPGHLRNLLSAESGCNDGMAFPFLYLSMNLIIHWGNAGEIVKDWICVTLLYECVFGCILGVFIGYVGKRAIKFAEEKNIIDRESFLAFYVVLSFCCAGFGSILGVDDLLVSFAAGATFAWDGWFSNKTEESKVSTVIDLLLNYAYFVYFGAIIPWSQFNNGAIGCNVWRLIVLAIIVIFLRRIPAVLLLKPVIPDIKSWREAIFVGHFGPIGVGAVFAAILARSELEATVSDLPTPLKELPSPGTKHYQLIACVWPMVCFFIITSIIVHGSSVAIITLGRHLNTITLTKTFTTRTTTGGGGKTSWLQRLPSLDKSGRSFSLQRVDTNASSINTENKDISMSRSSTIETSGVPVRHAGGMTRRKKKSKQRKGIKKIRNHVRSRSRNFFEYDDELNDLGRERLQREKEARAATFALSSSNRPGESEVTEEEIPPHVPEEASVEELPSYPMFDSETEEVGIRDVQHEGSSPSEQNSSESAERDYYDLEKQQKNSNKGSDDTSLTSLEEQRHKEIQNEENEGRVVYQEGDQIIVENKHGEVIDHAHLAREPKDEEEEIGDSHSESIDIYSGDEQITRSGESSLNGLKRILTPTSVSRVHSLIEGKILPKKKVREEFKRVDSSRPKRKAKYHAYKMNNELIIENEDGEVIRRYKINQHGKKTTGDQTDGADNIVNKALAAIGLRSHSDSTATQRSSTSSQHSNDGISRTKLGGSSGIRRPPTPVYNIENAEYTDDETENEEPSDSEDPDNYPDEDESYSGSSEEEEPETEFERRRRLQALGQLSSPKDDADEEQSPINNNRQRSDSTAQKMKNALNKTFNFKSNRKK